MEIKNEIVVYQPDEAIRLDVRLDGETVWLTQNQMAILFGCSVDNVGLHLKNIYAIGELAREATAEDFSVVRMEGSRRVRRRVTGYNLDAIISVGYRVNSVLGVKFRQWATGVLKDYLLRGYAINQRMNQLEDKFDRRLARHETDIAGLKEKVDFNAQYPSLSVRESTAFHDRFLAIDDRELYLVGASLKDLGRKCFGFTKMDPAEITRLKSRI